MRIQLNDAEVKHAVILYLKEKLNKEAAAKDIKLERGYGGSAATYEEDIDAHEEE